jgi:hypothetical protein
MEQHEDSIATNEGSDLAASETPVLPEIRGEMPEPTAKSDRRSRSNTGDTDSLFKQVASSIGRNPVPLTMIAGGLGYLIYNEVQRGKRSSSRPTTMSERVNASLRDEAASSAGGAVSRIRELAHDVGEGVGSAAGRVGQTARDLSHEVSSFSSEAAVVARKGQEMLLDRPLVLAGLGLALGAAIAGTAPISRREKDLMAGPAGAAVEHLVHGAQNFKERAKDSVGAIGDAVKDEASVLMSSTEQVGDETDPDDPQNGSRDNRSLT